ncbi:SUF system NifU family Fe-S cluster assembly protein [Bifidobacterium sp. SMB2]|uniref:SUF system NifU family Fe-S cluster assembly protein n=1 Tax=Bifidobacterium saimiriisciurei TaxID=2661627 RepID=A0ABX0CDT1_9BIFI|nr:MULTISPECIES: SUF system NifU family Fe-S cluster assembly protein [Bifidobacterium]NEG96194.1 SUF system NifU family Fe-S cluster assembly protein [Bifidobacterium sp. SMB2]NEH10728.1 SUF system NifU family Fe-S cluster assembly protein [Bifidobacterium saimiriisciurei]
MADYGMSSEELEQMYQEVILEASKDPHGKVHFDSGESGNTIGVDSLSAGESTLQASHEYCVPAQSHQFNPTCGDEVTVRVEISDGSDGRPQHIEKLIWDGQGCSISQASLSIMVDLVDGKTVDEAMELFHTFHKLMESRGNGLNDEQLEETLGDAVVFQGVSRYPMRIKCALLGWEGLKDSMAQALAHMSGVVAGRES